MEQSEKFVHVYRDEKKVLMVRCKNVTIEEINIAVEDYKKIESQIPQELKDSVDKVVTELNKKFPSNEKANEI